MTVIAFPGPRPRTEQPRIRVDITRRDRQLRLIAGFGDCEHGRIPQITDQVTAYDPVEQIEMHATVGALDERTKRLLLEPAWHSARSSA